MLKEKLDKILLKVQKPSRYIGGEVNAVVKDKSKVDIRFAFCFPDTYDIGMSHLGIKILYSLKNSVPNYWCERVFMPLPDMEEQMRKNDIPLYGLLELLSDLSTECVHVLLKLVRLRYLRLGRFKQRSGHLRKSTRHLRRKS